MNKLIRSVKYKNKDKNMKRQTIFETKTQSTSYVHLTSIDSHEQ